MRYIHLLMLATAIMFTTGCRQTDVRADIAALEKQIVMPKETKAIGSYDRHYAEHEDKILATFFSAPEGKGVAKWVSYEDLPTLTDGGCGVVYIRFDRKTGEFISADCGGEG